MSEMEQLDLEWMSSAKYLYEYLDKKGRDIVLLHNDSDIIDTSKSWNELDKQVKRNWTNWVYRGWCE